ncbi:hypothetical protein AAFF_G00404060 [Aldrovandia affinis]|uniref:Uncharacterized protein n=1 Tax=Aldrovandia affinis TaxID=143900 RepID=A0AAD7T7J8_9TELE|nr:hypothetical protein AAFF_G00404060 [Aldrovandia affinis]
MLPNVSTPPVIGQRGDRAGALRACGRTGVAGDESRADGTAPVGLWEWGALAFVPRAAEMRRLLRGDPRRFLCDREGGAVRNGGSLLSAG